MNTKDALRSHYSHIIINECDSRKIGILKIINPHRA